tara:strand:- start:1187 stop:3139 length:1953 start_codon:yes stop_codon:yes gene_type:complete
MSLVITSSAQHDETNQVGIAVPYQYRNNIKNPLMIPPNSEVAVESVKIQRVPMLDYGNNITTNFWFGERLATNASYEDQTVYMIPARNSILGSKSPQDFADEFKEVLQSAYSFHPEIDSVNIEVTISTDGDGAFNGFLYNIPQVAAAAADAVPPASTFLQKISQADGSWDGTTLTANADDCFLQLLPQGSDGGPLSLFNGSITYTGIGSADNTIVGISRPYCSNPDDGSIQGWIGNEMAEAGPDTDHPFSLALNGEGRGQYGEVYMDYCVENNGTDIRVYNYTGDVDGLGRMSEVVYYVKNDSASQTTNTDNSSFATGSPLSSAAMGDITFTVSNEKVKISVSGKTLVEVNTFDSASFKSQVPMPTSISNWKMYPTAYFGDSGDTVDIGRYECRTSSTISKNFPENSWIARTKIPTFLDGRGDSQTQADMIATSSTPIPPFNNAIDWDMDVYTRDIFKAMTSDGTAIPDSTIRKYLGVQNNLMGSNTNRYQNIFIMGRSERYMADRRLEVWQPNSTRVLGFSPFSINTDSGMTHSGGYHGASFTSVTKPSLTSQQSTFIRVPTLTHETYNFSTGNPSKILFQIPRFDNSGAEVGALYFQNNDKSFVDLKNAAPLRLTDLDVHLVRKDETFAKDLSGSTEVLFMIRPKGKL